MHRSTTAVLLVLLATTVTAFANNNNVRIIDGGMVPISAAPFMASLRSLTNVHFCGGAIISNRYILTAAQCTRGRAGSDINVVLGTSLRNSVGTTHRSSSIIVNPFFNAETLENDIALVQTATVIAFTEFVQTAGFFPNFTTDHLNDLRIFGWGIAARNHPTDSIDLRTKITETISNEECRRLVTNPVNLRRITDHKLCTAVDQQSICYGDEGGVLVTNRLEIIGVASWHSNCNGTTPDVYERIEPHRLWIMSLLL